MRTFKFSGLEDQEKITIRETDFAKGKAVKVECNALAAKLAALPYFQEVKPAAKAAKKPAAKAAEDAKNQG